MIHRRRSAWGALLCLVFSVTAWGFGLGLGFGFGPIASHPNVSIAAAVHSSSASSDSTSIVSQFGGVTRAVAYDGQAIYLGLGTRILVLDGCDPARPLEIGRSAILPGIIQDLVLVPDRPLLMAALGTGGVAIIDIVDPARPALLSTIGLPGPPPDLPGEAYRIAVGGDFAWVAGSAGLYGIDIGDRTEPRLRAHIATPEGGFGGRAYDVAVGGPFAFVAWGPYGLRVFDIADPAAPAEIAGDPGTPAAVGAISIQHGIAWLTDGGLLRAIDVSDPFVPRELSATPIGTALDTAVDVAVSGIRAYVAYIDGTTFLGGVRAMSIADPAVPIARGTVDLGTIVSAPGPSLPDGALDLVAAGPRLLVAGDTLGLVTLDGSAMMRNAPPPGAGDPPPAALPIEAVLWRHQSASIIGAVAASSFLGLALGADNSRGMALVERPLTGARLAAWTTVPPRARDMATYGNRALVVDGQVHLLAIGTPADPRFMSSVTSLTRATAIAVDEARRVAYVANEYEGLRVVTIEADDRLTLLGTLALITPSETTVPALALDVEGDLVAVVGSEWLFLVDVSDSAAPRTLGSISTGGGTTGVALQDGIAWVTGYAPGLLSFDVSDPSTPGQIGSASLDTGGWAIAIDRSGIRAFVAAGAGGVVTFDIADPLLPREIARSDTPGTAIDVAVMHGEWAGPEGPIDLGDGWPLVADNEGGLLIVGDPALAPSSPEAIPAAAPPHRCPERVIWMPTAHRD